MVTMETKAKSEQLRNFIIELANKKTITMMMVAELYGINKKLINHHLRVLLRDGYITKHKRHIQINGAWACGYTALKNEPYVWNMDKVKVDASKPVMTTDYDDALMLRMGYTKLIPEGGRICLGVMSKGA